MSGQVDLQEWGFAWDGARVHEGMRPMRFAEVLARSERSELEFRWRRQSCLGSANAHSAAGAIATVKRGLRLAVVDASEQVHLECHWYRRKPDDPHADTPGGAGEGAQHLRRAARTRH